MNYSKPELAVLGEANTVIRGDKNSLPESTDLSRPQPSAFELED